MARITIYTTMLCPFCARAKSLLQKKKVAFDEVDVTFDREGRAAMRQKAGGRNSVPQIWIGETHIGGCDELYGLERQGRLDDMIAAA